MPDESPDERAKKTELEMTDDERFSLVVSVMGANFVAPVRDPRLPPGMPMSAGYTPGVPRLNIPALRSSDASLGITNPGYRPDDAGATALPASLAVAASFNPELARQGGTLIGREARARGFNAVLAGGINLTRDVRNGRNFEYYSEDPLLSGVLGAEAVNGIQGEGVISTLKHFCLNCNETNRHWLDAIIDPVRASRDRPARVPDRDRAVAARRDHEFVQQGQRHLCRWQQLPAQRASQRRVGISGLGDVGLGRDAELGVRACRPRPGVRLPDRSRGVR